MERLLKATLEKTGVTVERIQHKGKENEYITFIRILSVPELECDDDVEMFKHTYRINIFSRKNYVGLLKNVKKLLRSEDFNIVSVEPENYENDTGYYHIPITISFIESEE